MKENSGNFDSSVHLSPDCLSELEWWISSTHSAKRFICMGSFKHTVQTDASSQGWGAVLAGTRTGGRWSPLESTLHINALELLAVLYGLQSLCRSLSHVHVRVQIDNSTAVAYINSMGGIVSKKCDELTRLIWAWAQDRDIWISAAHIAGVENKEADLASRVFDDRTEWMLKKKVFRDLCQLFGPPQIDLFASRLNAQLPTYASWQPDPAACYVDAFTVNWSVSYTYLFPPFSLISRCLQKLELENAKALVIVPVWPTQCWFSPLLQMLTALPVLLPHNCLQLPSPSTTPPPKARLMACRVSGDNSLTEAFLKGLPRSSLTAGNLELGSSMTRLSNGGRTFVARGRLITVHPL